MLDSFAEIRRDILILVKSRRTVIEDSLREDLHVYLRKWRDRESPAAAQPRTESPGILCGHRRSTRHPAHMKLINPKH
jgi:hypothetical protein